MYSRIGSLLTQEFYFQPTQPRNEFKSSKMTSSLNNNLSELDTLLQDLSNSRYADKKCKYIV